MTGGVAGSILSKNREGPNSVPTRKFPPPLAGCAQPAHHRLGAGKALFRSAFDPGGGLDVIEFHGNLFQDRCMTDGSLHVADEDDETPACPDCGGHLRPGVVWFGEPIPEAALNESCDAAARCDLFLSVGTSSLVYPAAGLADLAKQNGAIVAEINPNPTMNAANYDFAIAGNSGTVLPELVNSLAS